MEGINQPNSPNNQGQQPQYDSVSPQPPPSGNNSGNNNSNKSWFWPSLESKIIVVVVVVAAVLVISALAASTFQGGNGVTSSFNNVKQDQRQAVFLSDGQSYFGDITGMNSETVILENIYYLRFDQQVQPEEQQTEDDDNQVSLIKLGDELHGPEDRMHINADEVVFWENLKSDGQVAQAIEANANGGENINTEEGSQSQQDQGSQQNSSQNTQPQSQTQQDLTDPAEEQSDETDEE